MGDDASVAHSNTRLFHSSECEGRAGEQRDRGICLELKGVERELKGEACPITSTYIGGAGI